MDKFSWVGLGKSLKSGGKASRVSLVAPMQEVRAENSSKLWEHEPV
jgi:hypothetical protein